MKTKNETAGKVSIKSKASTGAKAPAKKSVKADVSAKSDAVAEKEITGLSRRKEAVGVVVSDKMQKTIVVKVDRQVRHGLYHKYITRSRKFKAHDETNTAKMGDLVSIVESRPLSKDKRWALKKIVRRAIQTVEANV